MEYDEESEDYNTENRLYDPAIGRWFSPDPLVDPDETPYSFVSDCPLIYIDIDGLKKVDPRLIFSGQTAKSDVLSDNAIEVLLSILTEVELKNLVISSTGRTPEDQARIMFDNLESGTSSSYGAPGQKVIALYKKLKKEGVKGNEIKEQMADLIKELGPSTVSQHCADPSKVNAIDIPYERYVKVISKEKRDALYDYLLELRKKGVIKRFLHPDHDDDKVGYNPGEAAYHIEIAADGNFKNTPKSKGNDNANAIRSIKTIFKLVKVATLPFVIMNDINKNLKNHGNHIKRQFKWNWPSKSKPRKSGKPQNINYSKTSSSGKVK